MSQDIINRLINNVINSQRVKKDLVTIARRYVDKNKLHAITLTKKDIAEILTINYVAIMQKTNIDSILKNDKTLKRNEATVIAANLLSTDIKAQLNTLADKIYELFPSRYAPESNERLTDRGDSIEIFQPRNKVNKIKNKIFALLSENASSYSTAFEEAFKPTTKKDARGASDTQQQNWREFTRRFQFLHTGENTVGTTIIYLLSQTKFKKMPRGDKGKAIKVAQQAILEYLLTLAADWVSADAETKRNITITGKLGPTTFNPPGDQDTDWKNAQIKVQKVVRDALAGAGLSDFATEKGSQPFDKRLGAFIVNSSIQSLKKDKKIKVKKLVQDKPRDYKKKNAAKKAKHIKPPNIVSKNSVRVVAQKIPKDTKESSINLNALKAQINARLSMTVIKNMGTPALENRTGRFARSAIVTDVVQTSQGFPSIGYTYQKYPYQTFEPGFKQGSTQRDPRTLIDRSIREIAQQLIVGRFYTRRV